MIATDAQIAKDYGPPCSGDALRITLFGGGKVTVQPVFGDAVLAFDACLRAHNYRARPEDTGGFACRRKRLLSGDFGDEWSTHAFKGTIDLNWSTNPMGRALVTDYPPALIAAIEGIRTRSGAQVWAWGGRWKSNKDAMHWQPGCRRADLATGIDPRTVPGGSPPPHHPSAPPGPSAADLQLIQRLLQEDDDMIIIRDGIGIALLVNNRVVGQSVAGLKKLREDYKRANRPLVEHTCENDTEWLSFGGWARK